METQTNNQTKCTCKHGKIVAVILVVLIVGAICWHVHHLPRKGSKDDAKSGTLFDMELGTDCTVQFRRDALGGSTSLTAPTTTGINGTTFIIKGTLIAVNHEAILLEQIDDHYIVNDVPQLKQLWIPKSSILYIEYSKGRTE